MGFLDNSGDIILDAVLTDVGRQRLAKGDGSFKITQFALGDDEINYSLYDKTKNSSAEFDAELMKTPIFEAFTNNAASLNSRLISFSRNNLMYLPVLKINNLVPGTSFATAKLVQNGYVLAVDEDTEQFLTTTNLTYEGDAISKNGVLFGINPGNGQHIRLDQGIDNSNMPPAIALDSDLVENQYLIEVDNRFMSVASPAANMFSLSPSYIDDDDIAAYYVSVDDDTSTVEMNTTTTTISTGQDNSQIIAGARGTMLKMRLRSQLEVSTSDFLFNKLGTQIKDGFKINNVSITDFANIKSIMTSVRVTGLNTGYSIDVPLLVIKAY